MPIIEKHITSSRVIKRTIIAACFLLTTLIALFFITYFQESQKKPPQDVKQVPTPVRQHQLQEADRQLLIAQGLHNPVNDLVQSLMEHNALIPCKGAAGGTPGFYNPDGISVLSKDRVRADYDDGHVEGTVELAYTVSNGAISWKVKGAECGK